MKSYVAVFIGGAIGSLLRYAVNLLGGTAVFPWPTFIENASGSLLLGLLTGFFAAGKKAARPIMLRDGVLRRVYDNVRFF